MNNKFIAIAFFLFSPLAFAKNGLIYDFGQGAGYVFQGDEWQSALTLGYFANEFDSKDSAFTYKVSIRKDFFKVEEIPVSLGVSFSQVLQSSPLDDSNTTLSLPVGIRYPLAQNLQLDIFVNIVSVVETFVYDYTLDERVYDGPRDGKRFLSSGGITISLFL